MIVDFDPRWYTRWCEPIVKALFERDQAAFNKHFEKAFEAYYSPELDADDKLCMFYQLGYLGFQSHLVFGNRGQLVNETPIIKEFLGRPASAPVAEGLRARLFLQIRVSLDRLGIQQLIPGEFDSLFEFVPIDQHNTELWLFCSSWAFRHRHLTVLESAYEYAVQRGNGFLAEWSWQRIEVMLKLLRGNAGEDDLLWLIGKACLPNQLKSIRNNIWPIANDLGLVSARVQDALDEREDQLNSEKDRNLSKMLNQFSAGSEKRPSTMGIKTRNVADYR